MAKSLEMKCSDGTRYRIPAQFIAENRARYYAARDKDTSFEEELAFTLGDHYELTDWASNNMNWADLAVVAVKVEEPRDLDLQEEWLNSEKKIVDLPDEENP